jgi:cephalosporin hydroxylase
MTDFETERAEIARQLSLNEDFAEVSKSWMNHSAKMKHSYLFDWLGIPIIQIPQDMYALQEVIYSVKPDLVIETGIARGGSLQLSASLLSMLDIADFMNLTPNAGFIPKRKVLGIDIEIRDHARESISKSFLKPWIETMECDSTDPSLVTALDAVTEKYEKVLVILDSDHTKSHVDKELALYSKYVSSGSYLIVFDTVIEYLESQLPGRSWGPGNGPLNAVNEFLQHNSDFEVDEMISTKLSVSCAPHGYLKRK